jgi:hypothetical protein
MADLNKQILIKLLIDNKEVQAALQLDDALLDKVSKKVAQFNHGTVGAGNAAKQATPGLNQMNMAIMQTGYVMNDAQMFLVNFRMGMMGVANNIPMIVQNFTQAKQAAGGAATGFQLITKSLMGGGGLILAINAVMFVANALPMILDKTGEQAGKTKLKLDDLTTSVNRLSDGFSDVQKEIDGLSFQELSDRYEALILGINASERKLKEDSIWKTIWSGITFRPLTNFLFGRDFFWQTAFDGPSSDDTNTLQMQEKLKVKIEDTGNKIKSFITAGHTAKSLLGLSPDDRKEMSKHLEDILNTWPEATKNMEIGYGDKLKEAEGFYFRIGSYAREDVKKLNDLIESIDPNKKKTVKDDASALASEKKEAEELKGKLKDIALEKEKLLVIGNEALSQYVKERELLRISTEQKLNEAQAEISAAESQIAALQKKKKVEESDKQEIQNLKTTITLKNQERERIQQEYDIKDIELKKKHDAEYLKLQQELDEERLKAEKKTQVELLQSKKRYYEALLLIEDDPEERAKLQKKIDILDLEIGQGELENLKNLNMAKVDAMRDFTVAERQLKEQAALDEWYRQQKLTEQYKSNAEYKLAIDQQYANETERIQDTSFQTSLGYMVEIVGALSGAYSQFFSTISANIKDELNDWEDREKKKLDIERESALKHARTQKQKEKINAEFDAKEDALEEQKKKKAEEALQTYWTIQQAFNYASAISNTALAATKALTAAPPPWNFALMASVIAAGMLQVATITAQKMPGYAKGGAIVGENGPEIIAPFQDYASGQSKLIAMTMMTVRDEIRSGRASNYVSGGFSSDSSSIKNLENAVSRLNDRLDAGIYAYQDDRQAKKAYRAARKQNSRAKI